MSDIKCPFCQRAELQEDVGYDGDYSCPNCKQPYFGSIELWQELIRTKKQLEIAVDSLKRLDKELYFNNAKQTGHIADSVMSIPSIALEQITALEQKD